MAKNPNQLFNLETPKVSQNMLDDEVREMFSNRTEGLEYIYDTYPEGKDRANALARLDKVYPDQRNIREKWNDYINYGLPYGSEERPELWNEEFIGIEKNLPFKDEEEHKKWSDQAATWMGEPEWLNMTDELITRAGYPKPKEEQSQLKSKLPF